MGLCTFGNSVVGSMHVNFQLVLSAVVLTVGAVDAAPSRPGDDLLQRRCREKSHDEAFSGLIKPVDRKSCAFFAEQNAYLPYELKVETAGDVTKLKGTVAGIGSYEGALVACGTASRCLQIEKSPEDKINGALMFYSNAEVETSNEKTADVSYVASLDCNNGDPGRRYFEIRRTPSAEEITSIQSFYGVTLDLAKLSECLQGKPSIPSQ